jgi:hypothetical protein
MASAAAQFHSRDDVPHFTRNLDAGAQAMLSCCPDETNKNGPQEESRFSVTLGRGEDKWPSRCRTGGRAYLTPQV